MKNAIQLTINKLQALERTIELHSFNDEQNLEEALDEINSAMICIDELEDILERDAELKLMKEEMNLA
jgi:hypothetical protein